MPYMRNSDAARFSGTDKVIFDQILAGMRERRDPVYLEALLHLWPDFPVTKSDALKLAQVIHDAYGDSAAKLLELYKEHFEAVPR